MGFFGPYHFESKDPAQKKKKWYLHSKTKGKSKIYYFSKDKVGAEQNLPRGMEVFESKRTGLPMLRKKVGNSQKGTSVKDIEKQAKEAEKG